MPFFYGWLVDRLTCFDTFLSVCLSVLSICFGYSPAFFPSFFSFLFFTSLRRRTGERALGRWAGLPSLSFGLCFCFCFIDPVRPDFDSLGLTFTSLNLTSLSYFLFCLSFLLPLCSTLLYFALGDVNSVGFGGGYEMKGRKGRGGIVVLPCVFVFVFIVYRNWMGR